MLTLRWTAPGEPVAELIAQRHAVYGGELGWIHDGSTVAWDRYDRYSHALLVHEGGALVASGRLTVESDGASELSDLCDWRAALPAALAAGVAAEWARVMVAPQHRHSGLFRRMYGETRDEARRRGAALLCGASTVELRPLYQSLGFTYLDRPFRSPFFDDSPVYFPAYQRLG